MNAGPNPRLTDGPASGTRRYFTLLLLLVLLLLLLLLLLPQASNKLALIDRMPCCCCPAGGVGECALPRKRRSCECGRHSLGPQPARLQGKQVPNVPYRAYRQYIIPLPWAATISAHTNGTQQSVPVSSLILHCSALPSSGIASIW
jgi:hypothetical protein